MSREAAVLDAIAASYRERGYEVFLHPDATLLPPDVAPYRPDAVAFKNGEKIAIEVKSSTSKAREIPPGILEAFKKSHGWSFRVIYAAPTLAEEFPSQSRKSSLEEMLKEADILSESGHQVAAFLLSWALLEGIARSLPTASEQFRQPQNPSRLVERLAREGIISQRRAQDLLAYVKLRNALVHGDFTRGVSRSDVSRLTDVLRSIIRRIPEGHATASP